MITEPIKDNKELQAFLNFYADKKPNLRNHCLIVFGLNTALRISDILNIKWNMIYDFENKKFIKRLTISEHKTGKINIIPINDNLSIALQKFFSKQNPQYNDYIFTKSTDHTRPLSHTQAYRIIKTSADKCNITGNISCHSLRKTFGFFAWKQGTQPDIFFREIQELIHVDNYLKFVEWEKYLYQFEVHRLFLYLKFHSKL